MTKNFTIFFVLSILSVLFLAYLSVSAHFVDAIYVHIYDWLGMFLRGNRISMMVRQVISLILIPLIVAGVPAIVYWFFKKKLMPYFFHVLFGAWLVMITILAMYR